MMSSAAEYLKEALSEYAGSYVAIPSSKVFSITNTCRMPQEHKPATLDTSKFYAQHLHQHTVVRTVVRGYMMVQTPAA
jgi:cupin superfamily acireductone dioxygenase involved in methionine salvage